jgi:hypothetical protein
LQRVIEYHVVVRHAQSPGRCTYLVRQGDADAVAMHATGCCQIAAAAPAGKNLIGSAQFFEGTVIRRNTL